MSARPQPESSSQLTLSTDGPEKETLQTPHMFGHEKQKEKLNLEQLQLNLSGDEQDDEIMLTITDDFMNSIDLTIVYGERSGKIFIVENEEPIAEVKETNIINELGQKLSYDQFRFNSFEDEIVWITSINEDIRKLRQSSSNGSTQIPFNQSKVIFRELQSFKAPDASQLIEVEKLNVKRRRLDENTELLTPSVYASIPVVLASNAPIHNIQITGITAIGNPTNVSSQDNSWNLSFSQQFEDKFKEYTKFNSKEEEIVAQKFIQMMEGVCNAEVKKFDANAVVMQPMERQLLFQKIKWKLVNRLWNVAYVAPSAYGEQISIARNAVESTAMQQYVFLDLMFQLGLNKTENFMDNLVDGYRLSLLAIGDAQKVREQLTGAFSKPDTLEIYSETT
ncbi:MAG: hypothetical protein EZS28_008647 [Streblomastix strix]|uniref:Uncharacterized protein n=1 Tax=Streblomastix strix TaxID=222440 RepID=A0A5J4WLJ4_9EUKA|nr:MAG: hypothetical protein EZS28_008647 [Streblomastix strix]